MTNRFVEVEGHEFLIDPPPRIYYSKSSRELVLVGYTEEGYPLFSRGMVTMALVDVWCDTYDINTYDLTEQYALISHEELGRWVVNKFTKASLLARLAAFDHLVKHLVVTNQRELVAFLHLNLEE